MRPENTSLMAEVDLPLGHQVLGDVGQPQLVRSGGREGLLYGIVVDCWAGPALGALVLRQHQRDPLAEHNLATGCHHR